MFYVRIAEVHTTTATDIVRVERVCGCGAAAEANVLVQATGAAEAPFYVGREDASERATRSAVSSLPYLAQRNVGIARCPRCGRRDRRSSIAAITGEAVGPLLCCILVFFGAWFAAILIASAAGARKGDDVAELLIVASAVAFTLLIFALWTWRKWRKLTRWIDGVAVEFVASHNVGSEQTTTT